MQSTTRRRSILRSGIALAASAALLGGSVAIAGTAAAAPKPKVAKKAVVSVLHAIPAGKGADIVDVYAGTTLLVDDLTPGELTRLVVPAGTYDLGVYANGQGPGNGTAVLSAPGTVVPGGANATVTANLDAAGAPALNVFVNDTSPLKQREGRVIVRHIAAAPAVDVRVNGQVVVEDLVNPNQASLEVRSRKYTADVVLANTSTVAIGPATIRVTPNRVTIVYAWGSAADGTLQLAVQSVKAKTPARR